MGCSHSAGSPTTDLQQATHARTVLGLAYLKQNQQDKAFTNLMTAYHYAPNDLEVNLALAHYYTVTHHYHLADSHYQTMLKKYLDNFNLLNNYAVFLCNNNQMAQAEQLFDQALISSMSSSKLSTYLNAGFCAQKNLAYQRAATMFSQALLLDKNNSQAYQGLIELARQDNDQLKTFRLLQRYQLAISGPLPEAYAKQLNELQQTYQ